MGSWQYGLPSVPRDLMQRRTPEELEPKVVKDGDGNGMDGWNDGMGWDVNPGNKGGTK